MQANHWKGKQKKTIKPPQNQTKPNPEVPAAWRVPGTSKGWEPNPVLTARVCEVEGWWVPAARVVWNFEQWTAENRSTYFYGNMTNSGLHYSPDLAGFKNSKRGASTLLQQAPWFSFEAIFRAMVPEINWEQTIHLHLLAFAVHLRWKGTSAALLSL